MATCGLRDQLHESRQFHREGQQAYLCNTADVLVAALLVKAKVLVETEADIVTVKTVGSKTLLEEVLLESSGNGRLA